MCVAAKRMTSIIVRREMQVRTPLYAHQTGQKRLTLPSEGTNAEAGKSYALLVGVHIGSSLLEKNVAFKIMYI